jgi:hypothetical protein
LKKASDVYQVMKFFSINPLYKKTDKSECGNCTGITLVSLGSKLLSTMILITLRDYVDKVLRKEQLSFRKGEDTPVEFLFFD